jgi:hypothetical protein
LRTKIINARVITFPTKMRFKQRWSGVHISWTIQNFQAFQALWILTLPFILFLHLVIKKRGFLTVDSAYKVLFNFRKEM